MDHPNFIKPNYSLKNFATLPHLIKNLLTGDSPSYDNVILFLIDGFGWRFIEQFHEHNSFLQRIFKNGKVEKYLAQFPSTTSAQVTTLHTGMPVGEHGVFEWNYFEPRLDAVISPLLFSFAGTAERDTLKSVGVKPRQILPTSTFYRELNKSGVRSFVFQMRDYTPSTYSNLLLGGAKVHSFRTMPEALVNLSETLIHQNSPAYYFLYHDKVDTISHVYGPGSQQTEAEIGSLLLEIEHIFMRLVAGKCKNTLFLLTADHGQAETDPQTTIYLNRHPDFAGFDQFLQVNQAGRPLVACGSPRDMFLHIKDGLVDEAQAFLASRSVGRAEVYRVEDMVSEGYFGQQVSKTFRARAGDLVILPYLGESIWWYEKDKFEQKYYGHHGGLTLQEMEIPLLMYELG